VTFDDGHADSGRAAEDILRRLSVPATFFVPAASMDDSRDNDVLRLDNDIVEVAS
jgi:peptidoglycan/xylan/chitin deacetylase (PgdA/CDA1 family)